MANYEMVGVLTHTDESGDTYDLYPRTKAEVVEGLSLFGPVTTAGTGATYTATVDGITELKVGVKLSIIPHTVSTTITPTLNVNGLGAKYIRMPDAYNSATMANIPVESWFVAGKPVTLTWDGEQWKTDIHRPTATSVTPEMFGAVGDGTTDDTTALKACITYAEKNGVSVLAQKNYAVSDTLLIDGTKIREAKFTGHIYPNFTDRSVVIIDQSIENGTYEFHVKGSTCNGGYTFTNSNHEYGELPMKGICVRNCYHSTFVLTARNCNTGISIEATESGGTGGGTGYNTFLITDVGDNAVSVDVMAKDGGWVNENVFLNLSIQDFSSNTSGIDKVIGLRMWKNNSTNAPNNNMFYKPSLQCLGLPVLIDNSSYNQLLQTRCESSGRNITEYVKFIGVCFDNVFDVSYGNLTFTNFFDQSSGTPYKNNLTCVKNRRYGDLMNSFTWNFDPSKVVSYDQTVYIEDMDIINMYNVSFTGAPMTLYHSISEKGITPVSNTVIGKLIDLSETKDFYVKADCIGADLRYAFIALDENMEYVTLAQTDFDGQHMTGSISTGYPTTISNVPHIFSSVDMNHQMVYFKVLNENVKYIFCGVILGENLYSFNIYEDNLYLTHAYNKSVMTKNIHGLNKMKILDPSKINNAYVGMYVPNIDMTVKTDTTGNYYVKGYLCTAIDNGGIATWIPDKIRA